VELELTGAEIVIESLKKEGVETLYGYPGGAVLHIYDALYNQQKINHILVRHEQAAVHAADGYARATGKPGIVLVTSGPGATNAITGIATAHMDSIPMVVISGQVPCEMIGNDAFQEVDMIGVSRPVVKHNFLVKDVANLATTIKQAFYVATQGRPGPVVIDIPKDVTAQKTHFKYPKTVNMRSFTPVVKGHSGQINKAIEAILQAKKPMIYTGGGVVLSNASEQLTEFTRLLGYPITNTLMGLGAYPATDKQFVGMLGMHGTYEANLGMHNCDVLIAIGARFDDRVTGNLERFCPYAHIIHIDIDPSSISKNIEAAIPIVGDVKEVLTKINNELKTQKLKPKHDISDWWKQIDEWRAVDCLKYKKSDTVIKPQQAIETLYKVTNGDAYITSDVGQHQMWAAQYYLFDKPRRWINSGGLGTMGFGFPAAMGVKQAFPDADVACVTGEGSIQMMLQELSTCSQYQVPVKIINLNNRYLGMVRQWQEFFYDKRYSMSYMDSLPDFVKLVESYGHVGLLVEKPEDLEPMMKEAFAMKDKLVFMDIITDQSENVYPMIAAGAGQDEMILL
jgi:acetolactate synthase-1/2/3 large subunit